MARKTFISYKYSDVVEGKTNNLRDRIIAKFGDDAKFYRGEDGYTKDLSSYSASYIKETLKEMIRDTSVTILILSPNMKQSQWMNWELSYSLSEITRNGRVSHSNDSRHMAYLMDMLGLRHHGIAGTLIKHLN